MRQMHTRPEADNMTCTGIEAPATFRFGVPRELINPDLGLFMDKRHNDLWANDTGAKEQYLAAIERM